LEKFAVSKTDLSNRPVAEQIALSSLKEKFEDLGFEFILEPHRRALPEFMGSYTPDAIALKSGENVAFEIKHNRTVSSEKQIQRIQGLFVDQPDWRLNVLLLRTDAALPRPAKADIERRLDEARSMANAGYMPAAFITAWSLLEAVSRLATDESAQRPKRPATVIQELAQLGHISPETERSLRPLVLLRNRLVHGDFSVEPTRDQFDEIDRALRELLASEINEARS
jgi:uncharacterized protein YutE (UPF0331/DUF86 family)